QDQQGAGRRLLQRFQQGVRREAVQSIGGRHHAHLIAALMAGEGELIAQLPHLLDADLLRLLDQAQHAQIRMLPGEHALTAQAHTARRTLPLPAQNEPSSPKSEPVPACAGRLMNQQSVGHPVGGISRRERRGLVAEPARGHPVAMSVASTSSTCRCTWTSGTEASITRTLLGSRRTISRYPPRTRSKNASASASKRSLAMPERARARASPTGTGKSSNSVQSGCRFGWTAFARLSINAGSTPRPLPL